MPALPARRAARRRPAPLRATRRACASAPPPGRRLERLRLAAPAEKPREHRRQPYPGEKTAHWRPMLLFRGLLASSRADRSRPRLHARPPQTEGRSNEGLERLRDSADARSGRSRGAPRRDHRAHPRRDREGRRQLAIPRRVGPAPARLRDRPQDRRRLPPAPVRRRAGDARRGDARAEDHRRRHAPHGDAAPEGRRPRRRAAAAAVEARREREPEAAARRSRRPRSRRTSRPARPKPPIRKPPLEEYAEPTRVGGAGGGAGGGARWPTSTASSSSAT